MDRLENQAPKAGPVAESCGRFPIWPDCSPLTRVATLSRREGPPIVPPGGKKARAMPHTGMQTNPRLDDPMPKRPASDPVPAVEVTIFPLDDDSAMPLALAWSWLSADEAARASGFRFGKHRDRYVRGRGMMRGLLARRLGAAPRELAFSIGEKGKPLLVSGRLAFNLSHSEATAAFALGEVPDLGIDLERLDRTVDIEGLARRCFRETEIAWMHSFPDAERHHAFFRIWTAKEARMKATGEGFSLEPKRIGLSFESGFPAGFGDPAGPAAHLATLAIEGAACTVVALAPFRLVETAAPAWDRGD